LPSQLGRSIEKVLADIDLSPSIPLTDKIPLDPALFYEKLGYLRHPRTNQPVTSLAVYQIEVWKAVHQYRRVLVVKSNKVGLTTSSLMLDFQLALLPTSNALSTRRFDTLLIAQTKDLAKEHLRAGRKIIMDSPTYAKYLIESPSEITEFEDDSLTTSLKKAMRSEQTKTSVIYIRNPENERQPSRIIALGLNNPGAILSWRNVKHLHLSDSTAAQGDYSEGIDNALSRLANTNGTCLIETIPSGPEGKIYDMYRQYKGKEWTPGDFKVYEVTAEQAVHAGVIDQAFLDSEAKRLGPLYSMYYGAEFTQGAGNIFSNSDIDFCVGHYDLSFKLGSYRILCADPAFSKQGSKFGVLGLEKTDGVYYVKECREYQGSTTSEIIDIVYRIYKRDSYNVLKVDGAYPGLIKDWQNGAGERSSINAQSFSFSEKATTAPVNAAQMVNQIKLRIHPQFTELIRQMRTCRYDPHGKLDKSVHSYDLIDCLSMGLDDAGGSVNICLLPEDGFEGDAGDFLAFRQSRQSGVRIV
jgi:hypothetical protein